MLWGCGSGGGSGSTEPENGGNNSGQTPAPAPTPTPDETPAPDPSEEDLKLTLDGLIKANEIAPEALLARDLPLITDPVAQLGMELFFSKSLSFNDDVACASCHDPRLAGTDRLSLPVGIGAHDPMLVGPGRRHDGNHYVDPKADFGPNVPRNSPTTFNIAFYDRAMFWDGRVETLVFDDNRYIAKDADAENGEGALIRTPDSVAGAPDSNAGENLTSAQARFPVTSATEMRSFSLDAGARGQETRKIIAQKLLDRLGWEPLFRKAFADDDSPVEDLINYDNIAHALGEYQRSQVAIDNPFFQYAAGNKTVLSDDAIKGAIRFYNTRAENCVRCHASSHFSDENFYSLATPQIGRGKNSLKRDFGRYNVTRRKTESFAFRTPSLLNVAMTGPYMHAGSLATLEDAIRWHYDPVTSLQNYDFSLQHLPQYKDLQGQDSSANEALVDLLVGEFPDKNRVNVPVSDQAVKELAAFLRSLSSNCLQQTECLSQWLPDFTSDDPDGFRLNARFAEFDNSEIFTPEPPDDDSGSAEPFPDLSGVPEYQAAGCELTTPKATSGMQQGFTQRLPASSGFNTERTVGEAIFTEIGINEPFLVTGSVAAGDIDGDCDFDLIAELGEESGLVVYLNNNGRFTEAADNFSLDSKGDVSAISLVDVNGDGWPDAFTGSLYGAAELWLNNGEGQFIRVTDFGFESLRGTHNGAFADVDEDGDLDLFSAHWGISTVFEEVHLWLNDGRGYFTASTAFSGEFGERDFTFTPNFADMNHDEKSDFLLAADFLTTQIYQGDGTGSFDNVTDLDVITDENAMGAALGDLDNDGDLDWFTSNIYDEEVETGVEEETEGNWGASGNRLYRNDSLEGEGILLADITEEAGVREGYWAWGTCFKDFNNDGWLDIYQVNGWGMSDGTYGFVLFEAIDEALGIASMQQLIDADYDNLDALQADLYEHYSDWQGVNAALSEPFDDENALLESLNRLFIGAQSMAALNDASVEFYAKPARLFMNNQDGTFSETAAAKNADDTNEGRGLVCNDFDRDGDIDIMLINHTGLPSYYENTHRNSVSSADNFLNIRLKGKGNNTPAFGTKLYVRSGSGADELNQYREMRFENNFFSNNAPELHFGLADHTQVDSIRIEWPDGEVTEMTNIEVNQFLLIEQP